MKPQAAVFAALLCLVLFVLGCENEPIQQFYSGSGGASPQPGSSILSSSCNLSLHLDMETYSFTRPKNEIPHSDLHPLDQVSGIPVIQRLDIQVCTSISGEGEWFIQNLEPEFEITTNHEPRPDDTPNFSHAYIVNNEMQIFDNEGGLMTDESIELPDFHTLMNFGSGGREALWQQALIQAQEEGIVLDEVEEEFIDLKKINQQTGDETVIMLDLVNKVMTATILLNSSGEIKARINFEYDQGEGTPNLKSMHQALYEKSPHSGLDMVFETNTTFHAFSLEKNL